MIAKLVVMTMIMVMRTSLLMVTMGKDDMTVVTMLH